MCYLLNHSCAVEVKCGPVSRLVSELCFREDIGRTVNLSRLVRHTCGFRSRIQKSEDPDYLFSRKVLYFLLNSGCHSKDEEQAGCIFDASKMDPNMHFLFQILHLPLPVEVMKMSRRVDFTCIY